MIALVLMSVYPLRALAQDGHSHTPTAQHKKQTPAQQSNASALVKIVQDSTERFNSPCLKPKKHAALKMF
jgi:hypothetical protein